MKAEAVVVVGVQIDVAPRAARLTLALLLVNQVASTAVSSLILPHRKVQMFLLGLRCWSFLSLRDGSIVVNSSQLSDQILSEVLV